MVLSSSYEDHLVGVHLANKEEQDAAMQVLLRTLCLWFIGSGSQIFLQILLHPHYDA